MYLYMQQAAFYLGKAVQLLLPADATDSLDALEQEPILSLLTALAAVRCVSPDALQRYLQVRPELVFDSCDRAWRAAVLCDLFLDARRCACSYPVTIGQPGQNCTDQRRGLLARVVLRPRTPACRPTSRRCARSACET